MGRSMADPNFVYRPRTAAQRQAQSAAARRRIGILPGFCRVYSVDVPEEMADVIRKYAQTLAQEYGSDVAHEWCGEMADREFEEFISVDELLSFGSTA